VSERAAAIECFEALLEEAQPATGGIPISEVVSQTVAVLALLDALPVASPDRAERASFAFRECLTAITSWGRRLALLDLTPTSVLQIVDLSLEATGLAGSPAAGHFERRAAAAAIEGFLMGREERVLQLAEKRAAEPVRPVPLKEGVLGLFVSGVHDSSVLIGCVEALGRSMLDTGAQTAIVDFSQLGEPSRNRAAAMFSADEVARMLGGICFFTGLDWRWKEIAERSRIPVQTLRIVPSVADALKAARDQPQRKSSRTHGRWQSLWRRLRG
jgi:hypothetical protein